MSTVCETSVMGLLTPQGHPWASEQRVFGDIQTFGVSGPHWEKKSCLGPHIKYTNTTKNWWAKKRFYINLRFCVGLHSQPCWAAYGPRVAGQTPTFLVLFDSQTCPSWRFHDFNYHDNSIINPSTCIFCGFDSLVVILMSAGLFYLGVPRHFKWNRYRHALMIFPLQI